MSKAWFLVPARGGSRGLPRKNVRLLGGRPLIAHVLEMLTGNWPAEDVIVMTDSGEIAAVAREYGVRIFMEAKTTGNATLDNVSTEACRRLISEGASGHDLMVTVQPTCPFLRAQSLHAALQKFAEGARTVLTVVDDRHLKWGLDPSGQPRPLYAARFNRQKLPVEYRETGGVIAARICDILSSGTRIQKDGVELVPVDRVEALDIDDYADFVVAQHYARRKRIVIRADGGRSLGMGHIHRALALADELAEHLPIFLTREDGEYAMGARFLAESPYPVRTLPDAKAMLPVLDELKADLVFLDILDTSAELVTAVRAHTGKVVSFEDLGEGAALADLVINDLYVSPDLRGNVLSGVENALLAPGFDLVSRHCRSDTAVNTVLVLFGGTDPAGLTERALTALATIGFDRKVIVVQGPGRADRPIALADYGLSGEVRSNVTFMPEVMLHADLAVSSAGRTITELMTLGVPTLALCQNRRELLHTHASMPYGVMNLGLGELVDGPTLQNTLGYLIGDAELRGRMSRLMLQATQGRSNHRIIQRILNAVGLA